MRHEAARAAVMAERYGAERDADAHAHIDGCAQCQAALAQTDALDQVLAVDTDEAPRPGFDTAFFARLEEARQPKPRFWTRWRWIGAAVTAGATAAALLAVLALDTTVPDITDIELAVNLELLEDYEVIAKLDEVEDFELIAQLALDDLDAGAPQ